MSDAFVPGSRHPSTVPLLAGAALLDAEKLDAYRIALEFQAIAGQLIPKRGFAELRDQLDCASVSIVLNVARAVGVARRATRVASTRWRAAARPRAPPSSILLQARRLVDARTRNRARALLVRIVQMLSRLVARTAAPSLP
jgi:hypothetical protein